MTNTRHIFITSLLSILLGALLFPSFSSAATIQAQHRPWAQQSGLVGYWSFDGKDTINNFSDKSGNGYHCKLEGGSTSTLKVIGRSGQAALFNGSNQRLNCTDIAALAGQSQLTISAWMKRRATNSIVDVMQYDALGSGVGIEYWSNGNVVFQVNADSNGMGEYALNDTEWHFVTLVFDGTLTGDSNRLKGYIDGAPVTLSFTFPSVPATTPDIGYPFYIGHDGSSAFSDGSVDEVRVYNRALSANEVKALYNSSGSQISNSHTAVKSGLIGHWTFDGSDITDKVYDKSGQGNHGYVVGVATSSVKVGGSVGQGLRIQPGNYVLVRDAESLRTSNFTVSSWVKFDALPSGSNWAMFLARTSGGGNQTYQLDYNMSLGGWWHSAYDPNWSADYVQYTNTPELGVWYHLVATYENTGKDYRLYLNGVEVGQNTVSGSPDVSSGGELRIGSDATNALGNQMNGTLDDIRIYNRALSAAEVRLMYKEGVGTTIGKNQANKAKDGLVGYWSFNGPDVSGTTAYDRSASANNGSIRNGTFPVAGKVGQAFDFTESRDNDVNIANGTPYMLPQKTISVWIKPRTTGGSGFGSIVHLTQNSADGWNLSLCDNNGSECPGSPNTLEFFQYFTGNNACWSAGANVVKMNEWSHVAVTYDNTSLTNDPTMYLNGVPISSTKYCTPTGVADEGTSPTTYIGSFSGSFNFDGGIDEVRIYNRILSADEIKQLYNLGK
jgi:hypothetical protein